MVSHRDHHNILRLRRVLLIHLILLLYSIQHLTALDTSIHPSPLEVTHDQVRLPQVDIQRPQRHTAQDSAIHRNLAMVTANPHHRRQQARIPLTQAATHIHNPAYPEVSQFNREPATRIPYRHPQRSQTLRIQADLHLRLSAAVAITLRRLHQLNSLRALSLLLHIQAVLVTQHQTALVIPHILLVRAFLVRSVALVSALQPHWEPPILNRLHHQAPSHLLIHLSARRQVLHHQRLPQQPHHPNLFCKSSSGPSARRKEWLNRSNTLLSVMTATPMS